MRNNVKRVIDCSKVDIGKELSKENFDAEKMLMEGLEIEIRNELKEKFIETMDTIFGDNRFSILPEEKKERIFSKAEPLLRYN